MTDLFKDKAADWDAQDIPRQLSMAIGKCIVDNVDLREDMSVMDFGAGTGLIASQVASKVGRLTAVDVSQAMLDKLAEKDELKRKVEVVCQNILDKPLNQRFDLIVSAMALHHVEDTKKLAQRFAEHLKPGARVALADLDKEDGTFHPEGTEGVYHDGFERGALKGVLEAAGFRDVSFATAHTVQKEERAYPVFLLTAVKP